MDIWELVKEDFNEKIPRRTAILVKEEDYSLSFAYPSEFSSIGYLFDHRKNSSYDESPIFSIRFGEYYFPDLTGKNLARNLFYYERMEYLPSLIKRRIVFSNVGLEAEEEFSQAVGGGFIWKIKLICKNHPPFELEKIFYTIVTVNENRVKVEYLPDSNMLKMILKDRDVFIVSNFDYYAVYKDIDDAIEDLKDGKIKKDDEIGRCIILEHRIRLSPSESKEIKFGISTFSQEKAKEALKIEGQSRIKDIWNNWFLSLPRPELRGEDEKKAYYKCWWTIRSNYYYDERYGKTVIEALPVYRGYWQWSLPAVQIHTCLNPEVGPPFIKKLIDLFLEYQREDGYITHAIYLDEEIPGERWAKQNIIQTPHIPWVALRYYFFTKDRESLKFWYPRLKKYYQYLCRSRDNDFLKLHLWAIISAYDTGMDDYPAFQMCTFKEKSEYGRGERFCYPAIFSAERCYFEKAMGKIAEVIDIIDEAEYWYRESENTKEAMDRFLWDREKRWYGVLHEDGSLETIIGVDGLFPFAYGLVSKDKAEIARENFIQLLGKYGIYTVSPLEERFHEDTYWQGPAWPLSCLYGMATAFNYYPDLMEEIKEGLINFILKHPGVWECMSAKTGKIARGPYDVLATPVVSSNVGAGSAIGTFLIYYGKNIFSLQGEEL